MCNIHWTLQHQAQTQISSFIGVVTLYCHKSWYAFLLFLLLLEIKDKITFPKPLTRDWIQLSLRQWILKLRLMQREQLLGVQVHWICLKSEFYLLLTTLQIRLEPNIHTHLFQRWRRKRVGKGSSLAWVVYKRTPNTLAFRMGIVLINSEVKHPILTLITRRNWGS